jgi:phosphohistidine phosphatase
LLAAGKKRVGKSIWHKKRKGNLLMKTLLIMRHAKSGWNTSDLSDFERPLDSEGLQTAGFMGNLLYQNGLQPNLIISSPAKRAKQTAVLIKASAEIENPIEYSEKVYEASPTTLLNVAFGIREKHKSILLIGHNPGIESFIRFLTGEKQTMSNGAIAIIKLDIEMWSDIDENCGETDLILYPENAAENLTLEQCSVL